MKKRLGFLIIFLLSLNTWAQEVVRRDVNGDGSYDYALIRHGDRSEIRVLHLKTHKLYYQFFRQGSKEVRLHYDSNGKPNFFHGRNWLEKDLIQDFVLKNQNGRWLVASAWTLRLGTRQRPPEQCDSSSIPLLRDLKDFTNEAYAKKINDLLDPSCLKEPWIKKQISTGLSRILGREGKTPAIKSLQQCINENIDVKRETAAATETNSLMDDLLSNDSVQNAVVQQAHLENAVSDLVENPQSRIKKISCFEGNDTSPAGDAIYKEQVIRLNLNNLKNDCEDINLETDLCTSAATTLFHELAHLDFAISEQETAVLDKISSNTELKKCLISDTDSVVRSSSIAAATNAAKEANNQATNMTAEVANAVPVAGPPPQPTPAQMANAESFQAGPQSADAPVQAAHSEPTATSSMAYAEKIFNSMSSSTTGKLAQAAITPTAATAGINIGNAAKIKAPTAANTPTVTTSLKDKTTAPETTGAVTAAGLGTSSGGATAENGTPSGVNLKSNIATGNRGTASVGAGSAGDVSGSFSGGGSTGNGEGGDGSSASTAAGSSAKASATAVSPEQQFVNEAIISQKYEDVKTKLEKDPQFINQLRLNRIRVVDQFGNTRGAGKYETKVLVEDNGNQFVPSTIEEPAR